MSYLYLVDVTTTCSKSAVAGVDILQALQHSALKVNAWHHWPEQGTTHFSVASCSPDIESVASAVAELLEHALIPASVIVLSLDGGSVSRLTKGTVSAGSMV